MVWENTAKYIFDYSENLNMEYLLQQLEKMKMLTWEVDIIEKSKFKSKPYI